MPIDLIGLTETLVNGVARGLVLALLGAGITLVFGLGGVLNLAIGALAIIAIIAGAELMSPLGNPLLAVLGSLMIVGGLALAIDRLILSFVYRSEGEERTLLGIFVTLGIALALDGLLFIYYPYRYSVPIDFPALSMGDFFLRGSTIVIILAAVALFTALYLFLNRTYLGKATQTVLQDERGAILCGISPRRTYTIVFVLSAVFAASAGILYSLSSSVQPADSLSFTIEAVIVSIVGGVTSIKGTIAAGLLLGLIMTLANTFIGAYIAQLVLLGIAITALLIKPEQIA